MIIRKAKEKDIPRILKLLEQVLQIHADIRPDIFIPGTTKYTIDELRELLKNEEKPIYVAVNESVATITVKGNDFEVNPENQHVYTVTFNNTSAIDVVSYANGLITVNGAEGAQAEVYTLAGQKVVQFICNGTTSVSLNQGAAYIVKVGNYRQTIIAF